MDKHTVIETDNLSIENDKEDCDDEKPMMSPINNGLLTTLMGEY